MKAKSETVKVAVRVRPMNKKEKEENSKICVEVDTASNTVSVEADKKDTKTFQFDYVYPMETTQREVYDQVAFPIVESVFQGYNGTVFAYGQTGCGKTFTMMGVVNDPVLRGVIPNAFEHIFGYIASEGEKKKFLVRCSFVEIYNEEVRDLLSNNGKALEVREDPKKGTFVKELTYYPLKNTTEIVKCLDKGNSNRHVGATSMNDKSSRSHSLFTVYIEIEEGIDSKNKKIRTGKLNLVDLAGSERVGKTNATGQTFDEGKKINLSLTALGSVIDALASNRKHIPYKDSKLTRLLADSLGGNTKTVMFANVSPASYNYDETVGTLRYASRAKLIKNAPKINEDPKDALLRQYEEQIKLLKEQLGNGGGGQVKETIKYVEKIVEVKVKDTDNSSNGNNNNDNSNNAQIVNNNMSDEERNKLLQRIKELEKEMISGGSDNNVFDEVEGGGNEDNKKLEEEKKKHEEEFKEYRKQQLKNIEDMEIKYEKLREEKRKEEESLLNDVHKLRKKVKTLQNEIEDLKFDNQKDRTDFFENIKGLNKDNSLYLGIIQFLLSDVELKKIIAKSKYNEDTEKWSIHPFTFRNRALAFPNIKPSGVPILIENEISGREVIFSNYSDDEDKDKHNGKQDNNNRKKNSNKKRTQNKQNISNDDDEDDVKSIHSKEKLIINARPNQAMTNNIGGLNNRDMGIHLMTPNNNENGSSFSSNFKNKYIIINDGNNKLDIPPSNNSNNISPVTTNADFSVNTNDDKLSKMLLKNKEKERLEQLTKQAQLNGNLNINFNTNFMGISSDIENLKINNRKFGKFVLNPLKNAQNSNILNNKIALNFNASLEISNPLEKNPYKLNGKRKLKLLGPIQEKQIKEDNENEEQNDDDDDDDDRF